MSLAYDENDKWRTMRLEPCPFCKTDLNEFPKVMTVKCATSIPYLKWKLETKKIVGSDSYSVVFCVKCGATGPRGLTNEQAILNWNKTGGD